MDEMENDITLRKKKRYNNFISYSMKRNIEKSKNQKTLGYVYVAVLYSDKKEVFVTFLDNKIKINNTDYSLNKPILEKDISNILKE